jgi:ribosomal-protein-alanine N-acetyltransferase
MALFARSDRARAVSPIKGTNLLIRLPVMDDFPAWAQLRAESRSFLTPWEPTWREDDLTRTAFRLRYFNPEDRDVLYPFFICDALSGALLGGISFGHIRRGVAHSGMMGYWMGAAHAGKGIMTRAVPLALKLAFGPVGLRRVEAGSLPRNTASIRVLEANGFQREGYARQYLCINGIYEDHVLYAHLKDDPPV